MKRTRRNFLKQSASVSLVAASSAFFRTSATSAGTKLTSSELVSYDAVGLAGLIRKKEITPLELVEDTLRRIERVNPKLNLVLTKLYDVAKAQLRAKQNPGDGVFAGVPVLLKNIVQYKEAKIDQGSRLLAAMVAKTGGLYQKNSPFTDAMEQAGFIVTGVTNAPEFGLIETTESVLYGPARNPWNTEYTTGGSSGGSAAAVAAGIVPLAHANDGGGSIRIPACQCGVFGLKPTRGRELKAFTENAPEEPIQISSDLCVSRSVRDTAAFLNIVENKNNAALPPVGFVSGPAKKRLRIALALDGLNGTQPDPQVEKAIRATAKLCDKLGHKVEEVKLPLNGGEMTDAFIGYWAAETAGLEMLVKFQGLKREDVLEPWTLGLIDLGKKRGVEACVKQAAKVFGEAATSLEKFFQTYDVLLTPVMRIPPYKIGWHDPRQNFEMLLARVLNEVCYTPLHNAVGTPAMSVPLSWTKDGLPIGSQFAAWRGGEATLLQLAYELEAAQPWAKKRPTVFAV